jgi:hypothetical protein
VIKIRAPVASRKRINEQLAFQLPMSSWCFESINHKLKKIKIAIMPQDPIRLSRLACLAANLEVFGDTLRSVNSPALIVAMGRVRAQRCALGLGAGT